ncbi:hypothetical protein DL96DRAFT_1463865 [Flagelloscypha sp. PMI_526]|nr:hypothetical protein DL96DRAFT_1463865 [Flagelloscypha sp. PMI_526]
MGVSQTGGTPASYSYILIRLLFRFVLSIFYGTISVEGTENIPSNGVPAIVIANHSNSLTDALMMVTTVPRHRRNWLRLTAKATQFGRRTFTSWLIESAGTVPIFRRKDYSEGEEVDNSHVMGKLMEALELGDAVLLFPEGGSRFHPGIAPLKTGVARLLSDVLSRNRNNPNFQIALQTCSVTYMHRQHFRSDVLVTYHKPIIFTPKSNPELLSPVDYDNIRALTAQMHEIISSGTFDSPSWDPIRVSKLAARIYVPLGTLMTLGDYVRVTRTFLRAFGASRKSDVDASSDKSMPSVHDLYGDLEVYQNELSRLGIKDDRVRRPLHRPIIFWRMAIRGGWATVLFALSLPGLVLWLPIFVTTFIAVHKYKKTGPIFDTYDEIAQYKLTYGFISGLIVYGACLLFTFPIAAFTLFAVPVIMWMALRWFEDGVASFRAFSALWRLFWVGKPTLEKLRKQREILYPRVIALALQLGLPEDPVAYFSESGGKQKGRVRQGSWSGSAKYFSLRRRRKRDWNETLRLYDVVDYPVDDSGSS